MPASTKHSILVLAIGNQMHGDDGITPLVVRSLNEYYHSGIESEVLPVGGISFVESMEGYEKVLILDAISTGKRPPGTILEFLPAEFHEYLSSTARFISVADAILLAEQLQMQFPSEIRILTIEIEQPLEITQIFSPAIQQSVEPMIQRAEAILDHWFSEATTSHQNIPSQA